MRRDLLGKRVAAVCIQPFGSLAPVSVGISTMFEVPDSMSDEDAAAFMIPAHTAWHAVHRRGKIQAGETVVVMGAAGGLGAAIVQLCVAAGCDVFAVVGGRGEGRVWSRSSARRRSTTRTVTWSTRSAPPPAAAGVDVIVDPVQGEAGARVRDLLVPDGRHVLCGHAGGLIAHDPHFYVRNHTLVGATLGGYPRDEMTRIHAETQARDRRADGRRPLPAAGEPRASSSPTCPPRSPTWPSGAPGVASSCGSDPGSRSTSRRRSRVATAARAVRRRASRRW